MEKELIIKYNKLMATYLGYQYVPSDPKYPHVKAGWQKVNEKFKDFKFNRGWYLCRNHNQLPFLRDWNHLMEVVDKLERVDLVYLYIHLNECTIGNSTDGYFKICSGTKHKAVFEAIGKYLSL